MSITFTPRQTWIALVMFAIIIVFAIYNAALNIAAQQREENVTRVANQRAANASLDRQSTLQSIQGLLNETKAIEKSLDVDIQNNFKAIQSLNFTHQELLNTIGDNTKLLRNETK